MDEKFGELRREWKESAETDERGVLQWKEQLVQELAQAEETNTKVCEKMVESVVLRLRDMEKELAALHCGAKGYNSGKTDSTAASNFTGELENFRRKILSLTSSAENLTKAVEFVKKESFDAVASIKMTLTGLSQQVNEQTMKGSNFEMRFEKLEEKLGILEKGARRSGRKEKDSICFQPSGTAGRGKHSVLSYFLSPSPEDQLNTNRSGSALPVLNLNATLNRDQDSKKHNDSMRQELKRSPVPSLQLQGLNTNPLLAHQHRPQFPSNHILHLTSTDRSEFDPIIEQVSSKEFVAIPRGLEPAMRDKLFAAGKSPLPTRVEAAGPSGLGGSASEKDAKEGKNGLQRSGSNQNLPGGVHPVYNTGLGVFGEESCSSLEEEFKFRLGGHSKAIQANSRLDYSNSVKDMGHHSGESNSGIIPTKLGAKSIKDANPNTPTERFASDSRHKNQETTIVQNFSTNHIGSGTESYKLQTDNTRNQLHSGDAIADYSNNQNLWKQMNRLGLEGGVPSAFHTDHPSQQPEQQPKNFTTASVNISKQTHSSVLNEQMTRSPDQDSRNIPELPSHSKVPISLPDNRVPFRQIEIDRSSYLGQPDDLSKLDQRASNSCVIVEDAMINNLSGSIERIDSLADNSLSRRLFEEVPVNMLDISQQRAGLMQNSTDNPHNLRVLADITLQEANHGSVLSGAATPGVIYHSKSPAASDKVGMKRSQPLVDRKYEALGAENIRIDMNSQIGYRLANGSHNITKSQIESHSGKDDKPQEDRSSRSSMSKSAIHNPSSKYSAPAGTARPTGASLAQPASKQSKDYSAGSHTLQDQGSHSPVRGQSKPPQREANSPSSKHSAAVSVTPSDNGFDFEKWARENQLLVSGFKYGK